jgi:hypothetical protein
MTAIEKYNEAMNEIRASCLKSNGEVDFIKLAGKLDVLAFHMAIEIPASGQVFDRYIEPKKS